MELFAKTRASTEITTRKIVGNEHLNPNGTLFGGHLMCWMDEVAFMCARRFSGHPTCVTANIDNITFRTPLNMGEHVFLRAHVNLAGKTSMQIEVEIFKEDATSGELTFTNSAHLTFVCLDLNFKPIRVPALILETANDKQKQRESELRMKVRKRLNSFVEKRIQGNNGEAVNESVKKKTKLGPGGYEIVRTLDQGAKALRAYLARRYGPV